ncbi:MAG: hypothetical protein RIS35_2960 [Pseudomonadota bacterium]|jgi:nitroreductase
MPSQRDTLELLLSQRYGGETALPDQPDTAIAPILANLLAHRTVRAYDARPVEEAHLRWIVQAAQSAATSSNLQAWSVVAVSDPERKARLADLAGGQAHIRQAPLLLVWIADLSRLDRNATRLGMTPGANDYLEMFLVAAIDAALAAQNATLAAEALGLGTCYIGAMRNRPEDVAAELGLPAHAFAVFGMTLGWADAERPASIKPRLPVDEVLHRETYRSNEDAERETVTAYDATMQAFQRSQSMPEIAWSKQSSQRVAGPESLSGRDRLGDALRALGFGIR